MMHHLKKFQEEMIQLDKGTCSRLISELDICLTQWKDPVQMGRLEPVQFEQFYQTLMTMLTQKLEIIETAEKTSHCLEKEHAHDVDALFSELGHHLGKVPFLSPQEAQCYLQVFFS